VGKLCSITFVPFYRYLVSKADWHHLYDLKRWKALRLYRLGIEPLCRFCKQAGKDRPASVVDHVVPHKGDVDLFFDLENTQSLCKPCHDGTKQSAEHRGYERGCDASGMPLDASHHWR
jgi:5-methylcytosine-specific restriction endonuclease McrA